ncbi:YigZ family protein, partial [Lacticaseibacillus rhamnosus]
MKPYLTIKESRNHTQSINKSRLITHLARIHNE